MRTRDNIFNFLVTCVEAQHFLLPARKGPGAASTEVHILHLNGSLLASLGRGCREYPAPEHSQST